MHKLAITLMAVGLVVAALYVPTRDLQLKQGTSLLPLRGLGTDDSWMPLWETRWRVIDSGMLLAECALIIGGSLLLSLAMLFREWLYSILSWRHRG